MFPVEPVRQLQTRIGGPRGARFSLGDDNEHFQSFVRVDYDPSFQNGEIKRDISTGITASAGVLF